MAGQCSICNKALQFGHNVSHSKRRTNRAWRANVQQTTLVIDNKPVRLPVCTRCLRTLQKSK